MPIRSTANNNRFYFRISDLGKLLGKRPVTIRGWERAHLFDFPRDGRGERIFNTQDIRNIATTAYAHGRIDDVRYNLIQSTMTMLELLESKNDST